MRAFNQKACPAARIQFWKDVGQFSGHRSNGSTSSLHGKASGSHCRAKRLAWNWFSGGGLPTSSEGSSLRRVLLEHGANSPTYVAKYLSPASLLFAAAAQSSSLHAWPKWRAKRRVQKRASLVTHLVHDGPDLRGGNRPQGDVLGAEDVAVRGGMHF